MSHFVVSSKYMLELMLAIYHMQSVKKSVLSGQASVQVPCQCGLTKLSHSMHTGYISNSAILSIMIMLCCYVLCAHAHAYK